MNNQAFTTSQAAEVLNISPRTLEAWRQKGIGPPFIAYSSRCVRYRETELLRWIELRAAMSSFPRGSADEPKK